MSRRIDDLETKYGVTITKGQGYEYTLKIEREGPVFVLPKKRLKEIKDFLRERFGR